jgi:SPP1 family predicted phage head-tail adaptor
MALSSGKLRHRVQLQRSVQVQDPVTGDLSSSWVDVAKVWAAVEPLSAREFIASSAVQSAITTRITIRYREVDASMRIVHRERIYNIEGVLADKDSGLEYLTLPCSEGVNEG